MALYYRHRLPVRIMHWINVVAFDDAADERAADLQRASGAVLGQVVVRRMRPQLLEIAREGARRHGDHAASRRIFGREFDTTGVLGLSHDATGVATTRAFPALDDRFRAPRWLAMARRWHFFFAWVFVINGLAYVALVVRQPAPVARSRADAATTGARIGRSIVGPPAVEASARRSGQALQRAAEARLSERDLRAAAAGDADGARDVAVAQCVAARAGSTSSAGASRRARCISSRRSLLVAFVADPRVPGDRHGSLEQPALDDHRALPRRRRRPRCR